MFADLFNWLLGAGHELAVVIISMITDVSIVYPGRRNVSNK